MYCKEKFQWKTLICVFAKIGVFGVSKHHLHYNIYNYFKIEISETAGIFPKTYVLLHNLCYLKDFKEKIT